MEIITSKKKLFNVCFVMLIIFGICFLSIFTCGCSPLVDTKSPYYGGPDETFYGAVAVGAAAVHLLTPDRAERRAPQEVLPKEKIREKVIKPYGESANPASVFLGYGVRLTGVDGTRIDSYAEEDQIVSLPSGTHTLTGSIRVRGMKTIGSYRDSLKVDLIAGRRYIFCLNVDLVESHCEEIEKKRLKDKEVGDIYCPKIFSFDDENSRKEYSFPSRQYFPKISGTYKGNFVLYDVTDLSLGEFPEYFEIREYRSKIVNKEIYELFGKKYIDGLKLFGELFNRFKYENNEIVLLEFPAKGICLLYHEGALEEILFINNPRPQYKGGHFLFTKNFIVQDSPYQINNYGKYFDKELLPGFHMGKTRLEVERRLGVPIKEMIDLESKINYQLYSIADKNCLLKINYLASEGSSKSARIDSVVLFGCK